MIAPIDECYGLVGAIKMSWEGISGGPAIEREVPGFATRIVHRAVLCPRDLEARFGLPEGAVSRGEVALDQLLFMRPVAGFARHAMPVPGLYLCGAGTHPGPGFTGLSGLLAARALQKS